MKSEAAKRSELVVAAARDVLARQPSAGVREIAAQAGVSRATVYRHFRSRTELLEASEVDADVPARDRVLGEALVLLERTGLARLSMDDVADRARVSRATVYRLFPGRAALFAALVQRYSPLETIARTLDDLGDAPPHLVMPAIARAIAAHVQGRAGLLRALFFEATGAGEAAEQARLFAISGGVGPLLAYITRHMERGDMRSSDPLLAMQSLMGPMMLHVFTRPIATSRLGFAIPLEDSLAHLAAYWLRAFAVQEPG